MIPNIRCPVCKLSTGGYHYPGVDPMTIEWLPLPLYQRSYPGEKEYISPRCLKCFTQKLREEERKKAKYESTA